MYWKNELKSYFVMNINQFNIKEYLAMELLLLPIILLLVSGLMWIVGGTLAAWVFPIGVMASFLLVYVLEGKRKMSFLPLAIVMGIILVIGTLCYLVHDPAYDSNWYHQPGIYLLSHGWNPIYQHHSMNIGDPSANMWIDHYAKGQETICATIVACVGDMEVGKLGNFFLPISAFLFSLLSLQKMFGDWSCKKQWLIAFVVAFPPIIWNQLLSFYIDFNLYSIVLIGFCSMILYREDKVKFLAIFVCLTVMAISVKFNMLMWFGLLYMGFMIVYWRIGKRNMVGQIIVCGIAAALVSIFTFSFNPYITNTIDHHSPVYPLMGGQDKVDIMSNVEPESFHNYNNVEKILVADFSRPTTGSQSQSYQFPYGGYPLKNLTACGSVDAKLGGTGLLWIDALILSVVILCLTRSYRTKKGKLALGLSLIFFATQFIVPGGWFYRYVSYIYLVPILLLFASENKTVSTKIIVLRKLTYGFLLVNSLIALGATFATTLVANQIEDYYVKCINHSDKPCYSSNLFGFVRKIDPNKRKLATVQPSKKMEQIPLLPTRVRIYIDYDAINRNVETTFVQNLLLKKGVLK